jgi:hypothetical protein
MNELCKGTFRNLVHRHEQICEEGELILTDHELIFKCARPISNHLDRVESVSFRNDVLTINFKWQPPNTRARKYTYSLTVENGAKWIERIMSARRNYRERTK